MKTDDREGFEEDVSGEAGDPAAVFEALRQTVEKQGAQIGAEITVIRRDLEVAFDQFEKFQQPADYSPDLGRIAKQLAAVEQRLQGVEQSPILRNGPEHYAQGLRRSGESLIHTAAHELERTANDLERIVAGLAGHTRSAQTRKAQDRRMWMAGGIGFAIGIALLLLLPRFLPFAIDTHIAALVMGADRWNAGMNMMAADSLESWNFIAEASDLVVSNSEALNACREQALATGEAQSCTIRVEPDG